MGYGEQLIIRCFYCFGKIILYDEESNRKMLE